MFFSVALFFGMAVALQLAGRCYQSEFDGYPDEPAHYITGLMVHDYVASGMPRHPVQYAENYYLHYPKVALGHWPPLFYMVQGAWTLVFSPSRTSVLLLMALLTALVSLVLFLATREELGDWGAFAVGALFIAVPTVQENTGMIMAESLLALTGLLAAVCFGKFLESGRKRYAIWYGVWVFAAIMVKGTGWALLLIPPMAIVLARKWRLFWSWPVWAGMGIVALALPWQLATLRMARQGWDGDFGFAYTRVALAAFPVLLERNIGIVLFGLALLGAAVRCLWPWLRGRRVSGLWAALFALAVAAWIFHSAIPAGMESRKLIIGLPGVLALCAVGVRWLARRMPSNWQWAPVGISAIAGLAFSLQAFTIPAKTPNHFREAAIAALHLYPSTGDPFFISATPTGEGCFISEVAMRERRPGHYILRASKMVASSDWRGDRQSPLYRTTGDVEALLDSLGVAAVVVEVNPPGNWVFFRLVAQTIADYPRVWTQVQLPDDSAAAVKIYKRNGSLPPRRGRIEIDLTHTLGRVLEQ